jgi:thiol:disulfide interchange protein
MKRAYRPLGVVLGLCVVMVAISVWRKASEPEDHIPWRASFAAATQESAKTQKPVLAYFTATWCPPCQEMKHETWPRPEVGRALERFVPVKVDVDQDPDLAAHYVREGIPHIQLLNPDGSSGKAHEGFFGPDELIRWLQAP